MKKYDEQLERLHALKDEPPTPALTAEVRKALGNKSNYLVGKAANVAAHHRTGDLIPDLIAAFERFLLNPVKTDPQCWAKKAIVKALSELGHDDPRVYLAGLRHVQNEPIWGGVADTAGPVRAQCAFALVQCRSLPDVTLLSHLLHTLVDGEKEVRVEGARAIANVGRMEASLLLRLKALTGDTEPEVTGACLAAVLSVEREAAVDFVCTFLEREGDLAAEAALALGLAKLPETVAPLAARYRRERDNALATMLLTALAVSHQNKAIEVLLDVIETEDTPRAVAALEAIFSARVQGDGLLTRIRSAASLNPDPKVEQACGRLFPADH
ncbi:MAG: hypothetical protein SGI92_18230 [Bryobacteraceae bacterium]|nr:hypothetical protein [Bryobacteraceae bacterium]